MVNNIQRAAYNRKYKEQHRGEIAAQMREYHQRPEVKASKRARMREYYQRPEVNARMREYHQRYQKEIAAANKAQREMPPEKLLALVRRKESKRPSGTEE